MKIQIPSLFTIKYYFNDKISSPHFALQLEYSCAEESFRMRGSDFTFEGLDIMPNIHKEVFALFKYQLSTFNVKIVTELNIELAINQAFIERKDQNYTCLSEH